jgi:cytochrome P450
MNSWERTTNCQCGWWERPTGARILAHLTQYGPSANAAGFKGVYDPDNLASAATLNRVLEETLRLTPALYFLPRRATVDTWVETADHRKMLIPKGTHVRLDVWHANRCEEFWGKAATGYPAEAFAPERWEVLAEKGITSRDMLHFGFGHGPRFCPGRFLGLLEVGLVVGAVVKIFKFKALGERTEARAGVSTKPGEGVLVDLELRS